MTEDRTGSAQGGPITLLSVLTSEHTWQTFTMVFTGAMAGSPAVRIFVTARPPWASSTR